MGLKVQSDANTEMKSQVSCFSSLLNFKVSNDFKVASHHKTSINIA